jgi:probable addiction module antidote protein
MSKSQPDPNRFRDNPPEIAAYLTAAFAENDLAEVLKALNLVMRGQNVKALAKRAGIRREPLYRSFGGEVNPHFSRVIELLHALGVRIQIAPMPTGKARRRVMKN